MISLPRRRGLTTCAAVVVALGGLYGATSGAQQNTTTPARVMVQDTGLPGIDRGLAANEAPRNPYGRSDSGFTRSRRLNGDGSTPMLGGSVIVKFRSGTGQNGVMSAMREVGGSGLQRPSYADFDIMEIAPDADPEQVCAELRERPDVEWAQPRYFNYPMLRPNDEFYSQQWNFPAIDMERAWDIQPGATRDIIVAVLDSGVAFRTTMVRYNSRFNFRLDSGGPIYPALGIVDVPFAAAPEIGDASRFVAPRDFIWDDDLPLDLDGHGTHVSGTIGQLTNNSVGVAGMAYNVRLMPVKVIDTEWDFIFGSPFGGTDDVVARGIRHAADNGAKVINMSIGRTTGGPATAVEEAIRYAISRGVFVAVAAGNEADTGNAPSRTAQNAQSIPGMIAVAAVSRDLARAFYSNTASYVEIAAPGGDQRRHGSSGGILQQTLDEGLLLTFLGGPSALRPPRADAFRYYFFQGTSMATPHVAGFAALLMQQGITDPIAVEAAMKHFARDLGPAGVDSEYGAGLIQPRATLRGLGLAR